MKRPMYEVIEDIVIWVTGSAGIILGLLMVALCEGECYIGAAACFIASSICFYIGERVWDVQERTKK